MDAAHLLGAERIFEVRQLLALETEAVVGLPLCAAGRHEQVPEAFGARPLLQVLDDREDLPAVTRMDLPMVFGLTRPDLGLHESTHAVPIKGLAPAE